MWVTRSLSLFYHSVNCILRRLPRVQEITFHCFYSQGLMILKVPPSDLYKNANLAELRCDKKKKFVLVFSLHWEFWSVQESLSPQLCITHMQSHAKNIHVILAVCRFICSTYLMKLFSLGEKSNKVLIYFIFEWYLFQIRIFTVGGLWLFLHQNKYM